MSSTNIIGSKNGSGVYQRIIAEMPRHEKYFELFAGSAAIYKRKLPCSNTFLVDVDPQAPIFSPSFKALRSGTLRKYNMTAKRFLTALADHITKESVIYVDPPYLAETRHCKRRYYKYEFDTVEQHEELLASLVTLRSNIIISGYMISLYTEFLEERHGWRRIDIPTVDRRGRKRIECIWLNFPEAVDRHDIRYLGLNYRERFRIKRKVRRWQEKLRSMSLIDRIAVTTALQAVNAEGNAVFGAPVPNAEGNVVSGVPDRNADNEDKSWIP